MDAKVYGVNASRHLSVPGYEERTTFMNDFAIAERFGEGAVRDTFDRAMREWGDSMSYLTELCMVTNALCWKFYQEGDMGLSRAYADMYYECMDRAYEPGRFTYEEREYFFRHVD